MIPGFYFIHLPSFIICFNNIRAIFTKDYQFNVPQRPNEGCPENTIDYHANCSTSAVSSCEKLEKCFCEDHCSWDKCYLLEPPQRCLSGSKEESEWFWDSGNNYWVAQRNRPSNHLLTISFTALVQLFQYLFDI